MPVLEKLSIDKLLADPEVGRVIDKVNPEFIERTEDCIQTAYVRGIFVFHDNAGR
ncbi:MAG: hypothetical protein JRH03_16795 [Deltaproteobacteria bacterium]|nr:hypothetical protein [Deltaproteobacteria bacterium]